MIAKIVYLDTTAFHQITDFELYSTGDTRGALINLTDGTQIELTMWEIIFEDQDSKDYVNVEILTDSLVAITKFTMKSE